MKKLNQLKMNEGIKLRGYIKLVPHAYEIIEKRCEGIFYGHYSKGQESFESWPQEFGCININSGGIVFFLEEQLL